MKHNTIFQSEEKDIEKIQNKDKKIESKDTVEPVEEQTCSVST